MSEEIDFSQLESISDNKNLTFHGNPLLKRAGESFTLTKEHLEELKRCAEDPIYFAEHYMTIVSVDQGKQLIKLYDYQKRILKGLQEHRYNIILSCRQSGKCVSGDTEIIVRNPKVNNGRPFKVKAKDFYEKLKISEKFS